MGKRLIVYISLLSIFSTVLFSFDCNAFDIIESYLDDSNLFAYTDEIRKEDFHKKCIYRKF